MKKLTLWFATAILLFALNPTQLKAIGDDNLASMELTKTELEPMAQSESGNALIALPETELAMVSSAEAVEIAYANAQLERLNEIKEMDLSAMNLSEKRELRKEVRAIEKEQRSSGGIYISVGAAILIVLLLILIL